MAILKGLVALVLVLAICAEVSTARRTKSRTLNAVLPLTNRVSKNAERLIVQQDNAPSLFADHYTIFEGSAPKCWNVLKNDFDIDDDLVLESIHIYDDDDATYGLTAIDEDNQICYQPQKDFTGEDSFSYEVCDETDMCSKALVRVTVLPQNDAPVTVDDLAYVGEDQTFTVIDVLKNDKDIDGFSPDFKSLAIVQSPNNGIAHFNPDHTVTYTPEFNDELRFFGVDSFVYRVCDVSDESKCSYGTVKVEVEDKCFACIHCNNYIPTFNLHRKWIEGYYHTEVLGFVSK